MQHLSLQYRLLHGGVKTLGYTVFGIHYTNTSATPVHTTRGLIYALTLSVYLYFERMKNNKLNKLYTEIVEGAIRYVSIYFDIQLNIYTHFVKPSLF